MRTGIIKFNVKERGRQHRGQPRNFDTAALARVVNGAEVQERVKHRDLVGYFGHWPRVVFGMNPGEGGMYQGKQVTLEPALVTTSLRALDDGTIEHEAEFLDTAPGRTAKRLFSSKAGGFSSAIACRELAGRDVPIQFGGFDYVMEPNFSTNRGYTLDGVAEDVDLVLDDAVRESQATLKVLDGLYSTLQADYDRQAQVMERLIAENAELVGMLAKYPADVQAAAKRTLARLDSAGIMRPIGVPVLDDARLVRLAREFKDVPLQTVEPPREDGAVQQLRGVVTGFFDRLRG